jgi:hypothetical protein
VADNIVNYEKLRVYKYKIEASIIDAGAEIKLLDRNIKEFFVENNFNDSFFPILRMQFVVSAEVFYRIQKFRNKAKVKIRVMKFPVSTPSELQHGNTSPFSYSKVFEGIFQPFMVDANPQQRKDLNEQGDNGQQDKDTESKPDIDNLFLEMYLFNLKHLNLNKTIINSVIQNNTILNTIGYIFNEVGIEAVLMNLPENRKVYDQILIPPFNFKNSVSYLSNTFGIYKTGIRQFLDFDAYYLLDNALDRVPVKTGEYETVYINFGKLGGYMSYKEGSYKDNTNKCYVINLPMNASFSTQGMFTKELNGNKVKVYDMNSIKEGTSYDDTTDTFNFGKGYKEKSVGLDAYDDGDDKVTFAYNHLENGFLDDESIRKNEENNLVISMPLNNVDMEMLTLNKRFILRFEDIKVASVYNGTYKLNQIIYGFDREQNETAMLMYALVEFKLVKKA